MSNVKKANSKPNGKPGPLESLKLKDHYEMCGAAERKPGGSKTQDVGLEPAFNPSGQPKTLCRECRIGSAEVRESKRLEFSARQTDTIIAALRLWRRSPAYPEIDIAEEHGTMLSDGEIDVLIEDKINS